MCSVWTPPTTVSSVVKARSADTTATADTTTADTTTADTTTADSTTADPQPMTTSRATQVGFLFWGQFTELGTFGIF